ncbi:MAG: endonuclease domain-containing protein, partial [Endomicrobiales bacterium]
YMLELVSWNINYSKNLLISKQNSMERYLINKISITENSFAETKLWQVLRDKRFNGVKFRRQEPLGKYILDFVCFEKKVIVEVDGGQHQEQMQYDGQRTEWLREQGFRVIRFWNHKVLQDLDVVKRVIWENLK